MKLAGVVPAAGASSRMGSPKGLLQLGGRTFVRRTVEALAEGGCDPVFVVTAPEDLPVEEEAERAGARVLTNPDPGEGPITSLRVALNALDPTVEGVVYLPLDHPLVSGGIVARLRAAATTSRASLTLPVHRGKRGHPSVLHRDLFPELLDPSLQGGARTVVHRHLDEACLVEVEDPAVIVDIDTPEAYSAAVELFERGHER